MIKPNEIEQLKQQFQFTMSKVSHEIRNPVHLINNQLRLLAQRHPEITDYEDWDDILDSMEYLISLLNEISSYNNAEKLTKEEIYFSDFLEQVLTTVRPTLTYLNIDLHVDFPEECPSLPIDRIKMRQALINLLRNAQEAIGQDGRIAICGQIQDQTLILTISDTGCGISEDKLKDLFTPFVTFKKNGTGLGLAITRQVIEAHRGTIQVTSKEGEGTTFTITLPL